MDQIDPALLVVTAFAAPLLLAWGVVAVWEFFVRVVR